MAAAKDVMKMITDNEVLFVDLRFTDTKGKEQHVSVPAKAFEAMMDRIEDIEFNAIADARKDEPRIRVDLDEI